MTLTPEQVREAVDKELPRVRADLERLIRIPGIAFAGFDHRILQQSAEAVAEVLREAGLPDVRVVRAGGQPAVIGRRPAPPGAPVVLLYAHHDVQPVGELAQWLSDPFEPTERDGRLYARGAGDDKSGIMTHVAALRALGDDLSVGVVVFVEGEEEYGSASLERLIHECRDDLAADCIVIADSMNQAVGEPAFTTGLRGLVNAFVEIRTLDHAVHSGLFGGAVPDALTTLCRLLATLHDQNGNVAIAGLHHGERATADYPEERLRRDAGVLDGTRILGDVPVADQLWTRPAVAVVGLDAPSTQEAPNALTATACAKVSMRIAPGDSTESAFAALQRHCETLAPWGAEVTVTLDHGGEPSMVASEGPAYAVAREAWADAYDGAGPVAIGLGGSIPFIATFQQAFPQAEILITGAVDPDSRAHGPNESLHLGDFARSCLAEALFLNLMGKRSR
ncbi:dipeptidase [Streptomyces sp. NPDC056580]|uniref:dipeptidase n=1 Tax=Streptomyces sp. NPDC056580 TaxID=3345872 RepID=UPI0036C550A1